MPDVNDLPDLTFPAAYQREGRTLWDLSVLLYRGGAKAPTRRVDSMIAVGELGRPLLGRIELVERIHEFILGGLVAGGSYHTADTRIRFQRDFFSWVDKHDHSLELGTAEKLYLLWSNWLVHRALVLKQIKLRTAYSAAAGVGSVLDAVLNRATPLVVATQLRGPRQHKTAQGVAAEKQSLADTYEFGEFLQDVCDGLTVDAVMNGPLPLRIALRRGGELVDWSGYANPAAVMFHLANPPATGETGAKRNQHKKSLRKFVKYESDRSLRTRYPLVNFRCEAELLMFIGQTGMNLSQAHRLKLRHFYYASYLDGYQVRARKERRGGEVLFEIFREYKPHFERYLDWCRQILPDSDELFPFVRKGRDFNNTREFRLRLVCKAIGLRFISPRTLRNTRVNWLLRRSGDVGLTAAMAQHAKTTLLGIYERPSQQRAMSEVARFWSKNDPTEFCTTPAAPGLCDGTPTPSPITPKNAPTTDCIRPSGCLWCEHHRDIDSQDYVWSLACFRHLKTVELSKWAQPQGSRETHPAEHAVGRISAKLAWFCDSNAQRRAWVEEALARIEEGNYHQDWAWKIAQMEGMP
jgi:integrase